MSPQAIEAEVLARVAEDYRRRGYDVQIQPGGLGLPEFLTGYQPDLIARSSADSVVVEVKVGTRTSVAERFREVAERVNRQPGWRFSLVFVSPDQPDQISEAPLASLSQLEDRAQSAEALLQFGQPEAAFLLLWSALEGVLRLIAQGAHLPLENLPSSTLFRELYSAGEISREQFESLMRLLPVRNLLAHGFGGDEQRLDVEQLRLIVQTLLAEARRPSS